MFLPSLCYFELEMSLPSSFLAVTIRKLHNHSQINTQYTVSAISFNEWHHNALG